jgi:ankyrin repeat protein
MVHMMRRLGLEDGAARMNLEKPSLLWRAGGEASFDAMKFLLEDNTMDFRSQSEDFPAIHVAAGCGNVAGVKLLIDRGICRADEKDKSGRTPLYNAAAMNQRKVAALLINEYRVSPNSRGANRRTPLDEAAQNGGFSVVNFMLEQEGIEVDAIDDFGRDTIGRRNGGNKP